MAAAYGWSAGVSDDKGLHELLLLNSARWMGEPARRRTDERDVSSQGGRGKRTMTTPKDLTEQGTAVLAVLAQCTVDGQSRSTSWARDRSGLGGIEFAKAVKHLIDQGKVEREEGHADRLVVTSDGWAVVQDHPEHFVGIAKALTRCRNEVDREASSERSSWTVRNILLGAALLLAMLTITLAYAAWKIGGATTPTTPTAVAALSAKIDVLKSLLSHIFSTTAASGGLRHPVAKEA